MKIFSNFDTTLRRITLEAYQAEYGVDKVLCFGRSHLYLRKKFIFPFSFYTLIGILALVFFYNWLAGNYFGYVVFAIAILYAFFIVPKIGKYIDYKMDFIIVIPTSIMLYEQGGILKRNISTITVQSIKALSIQKSGLLYSIFNNGDIIVLTEGDTEKNGEIILRRIPKPEKRRDEIVEIIGMND